MGTYAGVITCGGEIPENKRGEFSERIEKLFQSGGMMEIEEVVLCGKHIATIRKAVMHEYGMKFWYNYFDDTNWETAGFDKKKCHVTSGKIGGVNFFNTMLAAYVLEEIYTDGVALARVGYEPFNSAAYVAWINYLFDESFSMKNFDPWKLFETLCDTEEELPYYIEWKDFGSYGYEVIGSCEIYAVLQGAEEALDVYEKKVKKDVVESLSICGMRDVWDNMKSFKQKSELVEKEQINLLLNLFMVLYNKGPMAEEIEKLEGELKLIMGGLNISDAPAFMIKAISDIYEKDFLKLWKKVRHVTRRRLKMVYGEENYLIPKLPTWEFLHQSPDDMIAYWEEGCNLEFTEDLWKWFDELKKRYDEAVQKEFFVDNPLKYVLELMEEADVNYYRIYTFADFFEETIENLNDKRYLALWKIYEEILRDPEIKMVRITLKRYMALMSNKELRMQILGV